MKSRLDSILKARCVEIGALSNLSEERSETRRAAYRYGTLYLRNGEQLKCIIGDVSASGARIKLISTERLPDEVTLKIFGSNKSHDARVAWKDTHEAGLKFVD